VYVKKFGVESTIPPYPSIVLGTAEVSPVEMAGAAAVFPAGGYFSKPKSILIIEDKYNTVYYSYQPDTNKVISAETCFLMTEALKSVVDSGTATSIRRYYKGEAAGKTGTTQNSTDAWFVGYTPVYATAIWVGFDNPVYKLNGAYKYGGQVAAPIFGMMMTDISNKVFGLGNVQFNKPETVIDTLLCEDTGLLATDKCPHKKLYPVSKYKIPSVCNKHN
jgi:penicillin-binding protein 1A